MAINNNKKKAGVYKFARGSSEKQMKSLFLNPEESKTKIAPVVYYVQLHPKFHLENLDKHSHVYVIFYELY